MRSGLRRALTIREVIVIVGCTITLLVIALLLLDSSSHSRMMSKRLRDATQLTAIHQSWLVYAREFQGVLPTPGLINRLPSDGMRIPGRGPEDITQNTTANLFSACIMANYFAPELCVGTTEPSQLVTAFTADDYNYAAYDAAKCIYWDSSFKADLFKGSNVSYAHMPIAGQAKRLYWRDTLGSSQPIIGNRGPLGGVADPNSITNRIYPPLQSWSGHIVFSDNHIQFTTSFPTVSRTNAASGYIIAPECLSAGRQPPSTDAAITFTNQMTPAGPVVQHD